jgi:NAD(P)-dependent dehydrogenase (short-subunit alcohol dehydrogenase family)
VIVSGASRGLGLEICRVLAERDDDVVALCRTPTPELSNLAVEVVGGIDVRDPAASARLEAIGARPVAAVISNAAINRTFVGSIDDIDLDAVADEYAVNALGAMRLMQALVPALEPGAKVLLVSGGSFIGPRQVASLGSYGYRMSKAALNSFGFMLAEELRPRRIAVAVVNPGVMDTDLHRAVLAAGRGSPAPGASPLEAARKMVARLDAIDLESSGSWLDLDGYQFPG